MRCFFWTDSFCSFFAGILHFFVSSLRSNTCCGCSRWKCGRRFWVVVPSMNTPERILLAGQPRASFTPQAVAAGTALWQHAPLTLDCGWRRVMCCLLPPASCTWVLSPLVGVPCSCFVSLFVSFLGVHRLHAPDIFFDGGATGGDCVAFLPPASVGECCRLKCVSEGGASANRFPLFAHHSHWRLRIGRGTERRGPGTSMGIFHHQQTRQVLLSSGSSAWASLSSLTTQHWHQDTGHVLPPHLSF